MTPAHTGGGDSRGAEKPARPRGVRRTVLTTFALPSFKKGNRREQLLRAKEN